MNTAITDNKATGLRGWLFYDGDCAICGKLAQRVRGLLRRQRVDLLPLQTGDASPRLGISTKDLLEEMRFLTEAGEVFGGAEAVAQIARRIWWCWPLFALSRVPGVMPAMRCLYRWIAERRNCADGACDRKQPNRLIAWLPLVVLPVFALGLKRLLPAWGFMWAMAFAIFLGCKWLTWRETKSAKRERPTLAYLLAWPGMDAGSFLSHETTAPNPTVNSWCSAAGKILSGVWLVWGAVRLVDIRHPLLAGWIGLVGLAFLLHFGLFHLLALLWQRSGVSAQPIMRAPILATSLGDFWGKRWNTGFHQLARAYAFQPVRRIVGIKGATFLVFFVSGLIHEAVISLPANGGYGWPTAYFVFQGIGLLLERSHFGRRFGLGHGVGGWLFTITWTAAPAFWLFHPPFIHNVILPFLRAIGAL